MSTLTATQQSFIEMMKTDSELAWKGFKLLLERDDYDHFFHPLREAGFFDPAANPAPVAGERENTVRIPYWPPLDYLKAVATSAGSHNDLRLAAEVMDVVRSVSAWRDEKGELRRNYHTNRIFAEILGLVPTNAVNLVDIELVREWLNNPYAPMLVADALDKGALSLFLSSDDPVNRQKAARILYHVTSIKWHKDGEGAELTPTSILDDFWLGSLLKNHARGLGEKAGEKSSEIMLERLREVFGTPIRRDHSSVFRPAVEDSPQNFRWRSVENRVVEGLREVILGWVSCEPNKARAQVQHMLNDDLQIIRRIGMYVLAEYWPDMHELYNGIVGPDLFKDGQTHELYQLLQKRFGEMSSEQQAATFRAIDSVPAPSYGDDPERLRRQIQYRWLSAISGKGYEPADRRFVELKTDDTVGKLHDHPEFDSYITSWAGPGASPYSPEELIALAKTNALVDKLNTFAPGDDWEGPTTEGLTSALETASRTNPDIFLGSLSQHLAAKPIYQHALISGLKQAWEAKVDANWGYGWEQLVQFFEQLLNRTEFWGPAEDKYQHWVVSVIAECLRTGTQNDEHAYDASLLPRTQIVIASLLQREPGGDKVSDDAMTWAINTPKGRIVQALYSQALRTARVSDQRRGSHPDAWDEIRPLFEVELANCKESNYEFSTLSGANLSQLQYLDKTWTADWVEKIFPFKYPTNMLCALDGLAYAAFTRPVYELLAAHGIIDRALRLELKGRSGREKLLERIGAAYLWGLEPLEGVRLSLLFETAAMTDLETLARLFRAVRNDPLTDDQRESVLAFWERALTWSQNQAQMPDRLLSTLSLLATHIVAVGFREQHLLESVAPHVHVGHEGYEFIAELLRLAPQAPASIAKVLQLMIAAHVPEYDYQDQLRSLLDLLSENGQREAVILISEQLRHLAGVEALFKNLTRHSG